MHFSEGLLEQLARMGRGSDEAGAAKGASRIIAAERMPRYQPFAMDRLERLAASGLSRSSEAQPQARRPAGSGQTVGEIFRRFDEETPPVTPHPPSLGGAGDAAALLRQAGYEAGYQAGREAGLVEGFDQGFAAGAEQTAREWRENETREGIGLGERIQKLCGALSERFAQVESQAADDLVAFSLEVARQALCSSIALRPEVIVDVVKEALSCLLDDGSRIRVYLNPADAELVGQAVREQAPAPEFEIVPDKSIERGGCRVETPLAEVDARVETRWRRTLAAIGRAPDGRTPAEGMQVAGTEADDGTGAPR